MKLGFVSAILDTWTYEEMMDFAADHGFECVVRFAYACRINKSESYPTKIDCVFYHIAGCPVYVAYNGSFLV